jgi:hypothetical protein
MQQQKAVSTIFLVIQASMWSLRVDILQPVGIVDFGVAAGPPKGAPIIASGQRPRNRQLRVPCPAHRRAGGTLPIRHPHAIEADTLGR